MGADTGQFIIRTFEDVQRLLADAIPEGLRLEYKSGRPTNRDRFKADLAQDVSAFANSAGGTLIIGVLEKAGVPAEIDGVEVSQFSRESLGQVIAYKVNPPIAGLQVTCLSDGRGKTVLVVDVPSSREAPHQGPNHTYYRRYQHHNHPMAHHEIEDLRRRQVSVTPLVVVSTATRGSTLAAIDVRNSSPYPASDITFCFSSDRIWPKDEVPTPIHGGIAHLSPGQHLRFRAQTFGQLFANPDRRATFEVRVEYTHTLLQQRVSHVWPLDFEAYRDSMSIMSDEHQERRDALDELKKLREATVKIARRLDESIPKVVGANGLDLSVYTLRNLQNILAGGSIERLPAKWFTASGFQAALGIPLDVAIALEDLFRSDRKIHREELVSVRGLTEEFRDRFDSTFDFPFASAESGREH